VDSGGDVAVSGGEVGGVIVEDIDSDSARQIRAISCTASVVESSVEVMASGYV
jgi:hypothetical protein